MRKDRPVLINCWSNWVYRQCHHAPFKSRISVDTAYKQTSDDFNHLYKNVWSFKLRLLIAAKYVNNQNPIWSNMAVHYSNHRSSLFHTCLGQIGANHSIVSYISLSVHLFIIQSLSKCNLEQHNHQMRVKAGLYIYRWNHLLPAAIFQLYKHHRSHNYPKDFNTADPSRCR